MTTGNRARLGAIALLGAILVSSGCGRTYEIPVGEPSFSPDGEKLIFSHCEAGKCDLVTYELRTGAIRRFPSRDDENWRLPRYSADGQKIAFSAGRPGSDFRQIAIMNSDGTAYRPLTKGDAWRAAPSFSPDGRRVIYVRAGHIRTEGVNRIVDRDIYEVDVETGNEKRLTSFEFFQTSQPSYLPDGRRFIFSGDGPGVTPKLELHKRLQAQYQDNQIYILAGDEKELRPAFTNGSDSGSPDISADGTRILFRSRTNEMDGKSGRFNFDIFIRESETNRRITNLETFLWYAALSPDGSKIVFLDDKDRNRKQKLWLMNVDGTGLTELRIPLPVMR